LDFKRIVGLTGNYGSGKTELAINLAISLANQKIKTYILDLDIVNPYFRCREARDLMKSRGINVVIPEGDKVYADLPIIVPQIKGTIKGEDGTVILDIGGDDVGARVISHLTDSIKQEELDLFMVMNANRPFTEKRGGVIDIIKEIEDASKYKITGILCNTHLIELTTRDTIIDGYNLALDVQKETGLPIHFVAIEEKLLGLFSEKEFKCPIFPIRRYMLPPWESSLKSKELVNAKIADR
jgi:MinD-like ATPase involved in chromosome partitioning or flagellar assembly